MGESKQVKVDNWGIFFLQRLQHFFNKTYFCDLTLQFDDNAQLKVHRLVMNACTEYFQVLEQTCEMMNDCLVMPPDLQADVVVPIVNFMYTGILEFHETIFDRLYTTARLMNMTVLTKLLDAQKVPISPIAKPASKRCPVAPVTWNLQGKRIAPRTMDPDLPEPLPGRKLPIWKRKSAPGAATYRGGDKASIPDPLSTKYFKASVDDTPRPTRFEWPDEDENSFDTSSFDEISYTSKPLLMPAREKSPRPSTSNFEELKRSTSSLKRPASPVFADTKRVNIQDVKEYLKEQKLRSDYIDYDDAEAADNDLQTYDDDDSAEEADKDAVFEQAGDETPSRSILKNDASTPHNKRVRFSLENAAAAAAVAAKATAKAVPTTAASTAAAVGAKAGTSADMSNHTKIITEVLKKFPHLVKKNKNIRLKILAKGGGGSKPASVPAKAPKATSKVSYMVMKPDQLAAPLADKKDGPYVCHKCPGPLPPFDTYYLYRKHLTEVHHEKADSQMCNICGHVSRKQNMLMYHRYVKHNITPPPMYQFPKCRDCPYIALSPTLLTKHQYNHTHVNLVCAECNSPFATKSQLIGHLQLSGHSARSAAHSYDCGYCTKKFVSDETLFQHIKKNHKAEARRDNIISCEEIDELDEQEPAPVLATPPPPPPPPPKEKIKILSDIKVSTPIATAGLLPVVRTADHQPKADAQPLEPSSEAESLSTVASGIAASLGLVNTIVVLDENQFILRSQDGGAADELAAGGSAGDGTEFLLPEVADMSGLHVSQHQVLAADGGALISQAAALNKTNIASTDELVMVLTDHDYSDASSSAMLAAENSNIVVLYSHPVQGQDGQYLAQPGNLVLNPDMSLMEVGNNYTVTSAAAVAAVDDAKPCEESIEMIQREINNHQLVEGELQDKGAADGVMAYAPVKALPPPDKMDVDPVQVHLDAAELEFAKPSELAEMLSPAADPVPESAVAELEASSADVLVAVQAAAQAAMPEEGTPQVAELADNTQAPALLAVEPAEEEPMEIEESIELIEKEIAKNSPELQSVPPPPSSDASSSSAGLPAVDPRDSETIPVQTAGDQSAEEEAVTGGQSAELAVSEAVDEPMEVDAAGTEDREAQEDAVVPDSSADEIVPDSEDDKSAAGDEGATVSRDEVDDSTLPVESAEEVQQQPEQDTAAEPTDQVAGEQVEKGEPGEQESEAPPPEPVEQGEAVEQPAEQPPEDTVVEINTATETSPETTAAEAVAAAAAATTVPEPVETASESVESNATELLSTLATNAKISNLLDDWDDGDTDSQQSDAAKSTASAAAPPAAPSADTASNSINTLINDWEDEEDT